jgi:hypothetical protein
VKSTFYPILEVLAFQILASYLAHAKNADIKILFVAALDEAPELLSILPELRQR